MDYKRTEVSHLIAFTKEEVRLIGLGLIRELVKPEDVLAAQTLNLKLLELRRQEAAQALAHLDDTIERAHRVAKEG